MSILTSLIVHSVERCLILVFKCDWYLQIYEGKYYKYVHKGHRDTNGNNSIHQLRQFNEATIHRLNDFSIWMTMTIQHISIIYVSEACFWPLTHSMQKKRKKKCFPKKLWLLDISWLFQKFSQLHKIFFRNYKIAKC